MRGTPVSVGEVAGRVVVQHATGDEERPLAAAGEG